MRIVVSAILFALIGASLFLGYQKLPVINQLSSCYKAALLAVDDKYIFSRRAHTTDAEICQERKDGLVRAMNCFVAVENKFLGSTKEMSWYKSLAKLTARSPQTAEEIVEEHNRECAAQDMQVEFDQIKQQWF